MANRVSDNSPVIEDANLASVPLGLVPTERLADVTDVVNKTRYSGKQFGTVIIGEGDLDYTDPARGHTLFMAVDDLEGGTGGVGAWYSLGGNTLEAVIQPVAPAYNIRVGSDSKPHMGQSSVVGNGSDSWHQLLSAFEFPVVPVAHLLDGASVINNSHYSGKDTARMVIAEITAGAEYKLAIATGPAFDDIWVDLGGATLGAIVDGPMAPQHQVGIKPPHVDIVAGDGKHTAYNPVCVSIVNSIITNAELADIDSEINSGGLNTGGKRQGAIYFATDTLVPPLSNVGLWVAFGPAPDQSWSNLDGVSGTVEPA